MASLRAIAASSHLAGCDELDALVGERLRALRQQRGLSAGILGAAIGVTAADIGRFEAGMTRIGAARLTRLAGALGVHISAFFEAESRGRRLPAVGLS
jgi:transcriptional regulator with XRE-family HTH domain